MGGDVEECRTELISVRADPSLNRQRLRCHVLRFLLWSQHAACIASIDSIHVRMHLAITRLGENTHDHSAGAVRALMLAEVVGAREFLAAVRALEWLLVSVQ